MAAWQQPEQEVHEMQSPSNMITLAQHISTIFVKVVFRLDSRIKVLNGSAERSLVMSSGS
eukprot:4170083-Amphidinium_carterae.1